MRKTKRDADAAATSPSPFAKLGKWAGGITAVLSLVFGLQQFTQMVSETRERKRSTDELYKVGKLQQSASDYTAAWVSFEQGLKAAEPGGQLAKLTGQLGEEREQFRTAQEDLAMEWVRNLRVNVTTGETFSDAIAPLSPVLTRGISATTGERKADLLAHFGWANFLRFRDGKDDLNPEPQYRQALEADSSNPYAHAYLAHWLLWTKKSAALPEARSHFAAALRSERARSYVRARQVAAFVNLNDDGEPDLLRTAFDMRRNNETLDDRTQGKIQSMYVSLCRVIWRGYDYEGRSGPIRSALPASDHLANVQTYFVGEDEDLSRDACRATLLETFGKQNEALEVWTAVHPEKHDSAIWQTYGVAAIKRLKVSRADARS
jgi:hypothetical protein